MKKVLALVLVIGVILSLGVTAFAAGSPIAGGGGGAVPDIGWGEVTKRTPPAAEKGMELYNAEEKVIATVPEDDITQLAVGEAAKLSDEDEAAFLAAYEDAQAVEGKVVKYFYWVDVPEQYKTDDFVWAKYEFKCSGENVEVTVNGNPMEVVHVDGVDYYAKLTEFGAVAILCD